MLGSFRQSFNLYDLAAICIVQACVLQLLCAIAYYKAQDARKTRARLRAQVEPAEGVDTGVDTGATVDPTWPWYLFLTISASIQLVASLSHFVYPESVFFIGVTVLAVFSVPICLALTIVLLVEKRRMLALFAALQCASSAGFCCYALFAVIV